MALRIPRAYGWQWKRRDSWILVFLVALTALMTSFVSTKALGQVITPPPPGNRPDDGLTLNQAVDRFFKENLELRALRQEIPMAQADIEAAAQPPQAYLLIEVGPGGLRKSRIQPRELIPRRWVDTLMARAVKRVLEAQYQDAMRTRVDNLYTAFVDLDVAQRSVRFNEAGLNGQEMLLKLLMDQHKTGQVSEAEVARIKIQRELAASAAAESKTALEKAKLNLANLLNLPDAEVAELRVNVDLDRTKSQPRDLPPIEELVRMALNQRPDLKAYRLGVERAQLDWLKALIEPLNEVAWRPWADPKTDAGIRRPGPGPPGSMTALITLPTTVHNRGKLKRTAINVEQARTELAKVERTVVLEVRQARLEYDQSRSTCDRFQNEIVPNARIIRDNLFRQWRSGEVPSTDYLAGQQEYNDRIFQVLKAGIRLRRSALALNTAVGERIMP
jgi:outer membrane protein, heavy metal efflux system